MRFDVDIYVDSPPSVLGLIFIVNACVGVSELGYEPTIFAVSRRG